MENLRQFDYQLVILEVDSSSLKSKNLVNACHYKALAFAMLVTGESRAAS